MGETRKTGLDGDPVAGNGADPNRASDPEAKERLEQVVMTLARLIGRRIARERFEALASANSSVLDASDQTGAGED